MRRDGFTAQMQCKLTQQRSKHSVSRVHCRYQLTCGSGDFVAVCAADALVAVEGPGADALAAADMPALPLAIAFQLSFVRPAGLAVGCTAGVAALPASALPACSVQQISVLCHFMPAGLKRH